MMQSVIKRPKVAKNVIYSDEAGVGIYVAVRDYDIFILSAAVAINAGNANNIYAAKVPHFWLCLATSCPVSFPPTIKARNERYFDNGFVEALDAGIDLFKNVYKFDTQEDFLNFIRKTDFNTGL